MIDTIIAKLDTLVVDDSEDYLDALTHLLSTFPCVGPIRSALTAAEALEQVSIFRPDLMLVDVAMPEVNGLELTRMIKAMPCPPKVIMVTLYDTPAYREAAMEAGADSFLGKSQLGDGLQRTLAQIFPGVCAATSLVDAK